jgi:hypothetical protein
LNKKKPFFSFFQNTAGDRMDDESKTVLKEIKKIFESADDINTVHSIIQLKKEIESIFDKNLNESSKLIIGTFLNCSF